MKRFFAALAVCAAAPAHANHPLISEDTGVLGKGGWQLELHGEKARDHEAGVTRRTTKASAVLGYGVTEDADLQLELPYSREGDATVSLKWRFYDKEGLSMVFKPDLTLPTGRDELGLGAGQVRWAANFAASKALGKLELLGHIGYTHNRNRIGERQSLWHVSAAVLWAASEKLKLLLDLGSASNPDPTGSTPGRALVFGLIYAVSDDIDLGIGLKHGLNDPADDRALRAGMKLRW